MKLGTVRKNRYKGYEQHRSITLTVQGSVNICPKNTRIRRAGGGDRGVHKQASEQDSEAEGGRVRGS